MDETFQLPVDYQGRELLLECRFVRYGYSYRIYVQLGEHEIVFEPDEERNLRAMMDMDAAKVPDRFLVNAVASALEEAFR